MAITIVATVGAANANSLVTEAEAIADAATRLNLPSTWTTVAGLTCTETEKKALLEAMRILDVLEYQGWRTDDVQALSWPREAVINLDASRDAVIGSWTGLPEYDDDEIPGRMKRGQIALAIEILRLGTVNASGVDPEAGVIRKKIDVIETEWEKGAREVGLNRFPEVVNEIRPLLADGSGQLSIARS